MTGDGYQLAEVGPGTWRIATLFGGRNLFQYVLASESGPALVIDAGTADTPHEAILPALDQLGIKREDIIAVVVTHPDLDHQGGLAALKDALPRASAACGFGDLGLVADPERLLSERYGAYEHAHGLGYDEAEKDSMRALSGRAVWIDLPLAGGERLLLGERSIRFLHAPGHSAGHLIVHEPSSGMLFTSDAVHGKAIPAADGSPALPPTYEDVEAYLSTIDLIATLNPTSLHSGHWPMKERPAITAWLQESSEFVVAADAAIIERLAEPATLGGLCEYVESRLGPFEAGAQALMFAVHGHLRRLVRQGTAGIVDLREAPPRFQLNGKHEEAADARVT
jgi:glyoxylase-like metal-dependent hydrolase (beta-lactamase superfamily II)